MPHPCRALSRSWPKLHRRLETAVTPLDLSLRAEDSKGGLPCDCSGELLSCETVHGLTQIVGVSVVPLVFLDHVTDDPSEVGRVAWLAVPG